MARSVGRRKRLPHNEVEFGSFLVLLCFAASGRVVPFHPLDVKLGQWEVTTATEKRIGWGTEKVPKTTVLKTCLRKVEEPWTIAYEPGKDCSETFAASTSNKQDIRIECGQPRGSKGERAIRIRVKDPDHVKGSIFIGKTNERFHRVRGGVVVDASFTAKWTGPECSQ